MSNPWKDNGKRASRLTKGPREENDMEPVRMFLLFSLAFCLFMLPPWMALPVHADPLQPQAATEPSARYGHTMATVGEKVYLFGGSDGATAASSSGGKIRDEVLNDLWAFSIDDGWENVLAIDAPATRKGHSTAVYDDKVFILFGADSNGNALNDTQAYSVTDNSWSQVNPQSALPPARKDSAASAVDGNIYVYGGRNGSGQLSTGSVWKLNYASGMIRQWTEGATHPDMARYGHTLTNVDGKLYVFGGSNGGSFLNDLSYYDPESNSWTKITPGSDKPPARAFHNAVPGTGKITVLGGTGKTGGLDDVWEFDIVEKKWVRRPDLPVPRAEFSAEALPSSSSGGKGASPGGILIFGGISNGQVVADTYIYSPSATTLTVAKSGAGSGTVKSNPSGIKCGSACSASFAAGTVVTLTAAPAGGSAFDGWSGGCSGTGTCQVTITDNIAVTASFSVPPSIGVSPASLNFNSMIKGVSSTKTVTIKNTGRKGGALLVSGLAITGNNAEEFSWISDTCTASLEPKKTCTVSVTFTPASYDQKTATLTISSNDPKKTSVAVKLAGKAGPPKMSVSPTSLNFGSVSLDKSPKPQKTITVRNTGISDLTISSITLTGDVAFTQTNNCATVIGKKSCTIQVGFAPTLIGNSDTTTIKIDSDDPAKGTVTVKVKGTGKK